MISLAYAALWIFVFILPWERVIALPGLNILSRGSGMLALGLTVFAVVISGRIRRWQSLHVAALLFVVLAAIDLLVFRSDQGLPLKFWTYVQLFAVLWIIWELAPSWPRMIWLLTAFVFGAYFSAFGTIMVYHRLSGGRSTRYTFGGDSNDLAMGLALALPMAWYLGMAHRRRWLQWLCRGYLLVGVIAIGLTGSRGGMLVSILALSFVPLSLTRLTPSRLVMSLATLGVAGALAVAYVPDKIVARLATTSSEIEDLRLGGRFKLWVAGMHAFAGHPVLGYGTGGFKAAVYPYLGDETKVAHNSFISVLVEQGMVGLVFYVMMFYGVFLALMNLPRMERRFALVLMATLLLSMMPLSSEDAKRVWFVLAALIGLAKAHVPGGVGARAQAVVGQVTSGARASLAPRGRQPVTAPVRSGDRNATA